jgi:TatD DNase family protein
VVDSHCHLADEAFRPDLEAVVTRARAAGLQHALCILSAGDEAEAAQADRLELLWPDVRFGIGVHPHNAAAFSGKLGELAEAVESELGARTRARALGEIGLDYHYDFSPRSVQRDVFATQLGLARGRGLPVIIHTREADADTLDVLRVEGGGDVRGVFHCFTGSADLAREALNLGFYVSLAGIVTFPKAAALRETAKLVPDDRLLIETDSPFLAPVPHRGTRNEPAHVARVAEVLAEVRGVTAAELIETTDRNFSALFAPFGTRSAGR